MIEKQKKEITEASFIKKILRHTYSLKLLYAFKMKIILPKRKEIKKPKELEYNKNDLKIVEIDITTILKTASRNNANVYFTNLPSKELLVLSDRSSQIASEYRILEQELSNMINKSGGVYSSFYEFILNKKINFNKMYFNGDPHYTNYGESLLADFVYSIYSNN